jgi:N-acetylmuramoyl-L-alanine amidase
MQSLMKNALTGVKAAPLALGFAQYYRLILVLLCVAVAALASPAFAAGLPVISEARVANHDAVTRISLLINSSVPYQVFTLEEPHRAVIDLPDVRWTASALPQPSGLFLSLRHGRFKPGAFRIVLQCRDSVAVDHSALIASGSGGYRLVIDLVATKPQPRRTVGQADAASGQVVNQAAISEVGRVGGGTIVPVIGATGLAVGDIGPSTVATAGTFPKSKAAGTVATLSLAQPKPRPAATTVPIAPQWVVAIDPGHGGQDPGAISPGGGYEKWITLAAARAARNELRKLGRYKVVLTRDSDRFIRLRDRIAIARSADADIFVSLHADTMPSDAVRGLSVYTLSERASDAEAAALAERENKVDIIGGIKLAGETLEVSNILIDLIRRDTMNDSAHFASLLVDELMQETMLLPKTHRFAGFAVLKAPDVPSVLIELGYLSNKTDERLLQSREHGQKLARGIARAIDCYFVRFEARNRH